MHRPPRGLWRLVFLIALVAGVPLSTPSRRSLSAEEPPRRVTLPVDMRPQETELWCWAATGQMTMEYLGKKVSQSEQANQLFGRTDCDDRPVPKPCIRGGAVVLKPFNFRADVTTAPMTEEEIVRQIATVKKPIPFGRRWAGGGGHIALVVGYLRTTDGKLLLEILDPYPPRGKNKNSPEGGQRSLMPYSRWAKGDGESVFDHALFNVSKTADKKERS